MIVTQEYIAVGISTINEGLFLNAVFRNGRFGHINLYLHFFLITAWREVTLSKVKLDCNL